MHVALDLMGRNSAYSVTLETHLTVNPDYNQGNIPDYRQQALMRVPAGCYYGELDHWEL